MWGSKNENEILRAKRRHMELMAKAESKKPWEFVGGEDELDIEGTRILQEIATFKENYYESLLTGHPL